MKTPTAPQPGYPVTANWGREVCDALRRMRLQAGPGIRLSQTPEGTTISAPDNKPVRSESYTAPQWGCSVVADGESRVLRVRSGQLGWGGAHVAVWPSGDAVDRAVYGDIALAVPVGELHYVVWYTTAAPVPLAGCPKNPTQTTEPCADCEGCTVGEPGDPASFVPDRGNVGIVPTLDRQAEWTDMRVLATVECTAEGVYRVVQIQTAEIAVNAIVYPGESGDGEAPACGHPGNEIGDEDGGGGGGAGTEEHPADPDVETGEIGDSGGSGIGTDHPGDSEGQDGVTPPSSGDCE